MKKPRRTSACEERCALTSALLAELESLGFRPSAKTPLDLLFADRKARVFHSAIRPHITSSALPPNSFLRLSEHVLIVCPELCLIQVANSLPIERLILMCSEFCGTYLLLGSGNQPAERPPLTTLPALRMYAAKALPPRAGLAFRRALRHAVDGAASPMEARVALMLVLPHALGGYNLPEPVLNHSHRLSNDAYRLYPHSPCRLDICWPKAMTAVEYDGAVHERSAQHARDVARLNALALDGFEITVITYAQVQDPAAFDAIARRLAARMGQRLQIRADNYPARQRRLRREFDLL